MFPQACLSTTYSFHESEMLQSFEMYSCPFRNDRGFRNAVLILSVKGTITGTLLKTYLCSSAFERSAMTRENPLSLHLQCNWHEVKQNFATKRTVMLAQM